nr:sulfotransferase domain-containing protein [Kribbella qitaiheensis]
MLDDLAVLQTEVVRERLPRLAWLKHEVRVRDHQIALADHALDVEVQLRILAPQPVHEPGKCFRSVLRLRIGHNFLSWLQPAAPHRVLLRYDDLARDPHASVDRTLTSLLPGLRPLASATIPTFDELHQTDPGFFRRGQTGAHRDELPPALHDQFWSKPDNTEVMRLLGDPR